MMPMADTSYYGSELGSSDRWHMQIWLRASPGEAQNEVPIPLNSRRPPRNEAPIRTASKGRARMWTSLKGGTALSPLRLVTLSGLHTLPSRRAANLDGLATTAQRCRLTSWYLMMTG